MPIAVISLVDGNRQWFKSSSGLDVSETPRDISFCGHTILGDDVFVIPNAIEDARLADHLELERVDHAAQGGLPNHPTWYNTAASREKANPAARPNPKPNFR